jgi:hypothetical protein
MLGVLVVDLFSIRALEAILVPSCASSEIGHHFTDRLSVNLEVVPAATIWGLL